MIRKILLQPICYRAVQIQAWIQGKVTSSEVGVLFMSRMISRFCCSRALYSFSNRATEKTALWTKGHWSTAATHRSFIDKKRCVTTTAVWFYSILRLNEWPMCSCEEERWPSEPSLTTKPMCLPYTVLASFLRGRCVFLINASPGLSRALNILQVFTHLTAKRQ